MSAGYSPRSGSLDAALAAAFFAFALVATPREARRAYGRAMRDEFALRYDERRSERGPWAALLYAAGAITDALGSGMFERFAAISRNVGYAARVARKTPAFSALIVATMAIAIGANVAIDSALSHLFLEQLPFRDSATLVDVMETNAANGISQYGLTYDDAIALRAQSRAAKIAFLDSAFGTLRNTGSPPKIVPGVNVSGEFFDVLRVRPQLGRLFTVTDERNLAPVVVLSEELWRSEFGADPHILGRVVTIDERPKTIVGVVPAGTQTPDRWHGGIANYAYYLPMTPVNRTTGHQYRALARISPGTDIRGVNADLDRIYTELERRHPQTNAAIGARAHALQEEIYGDAWLVGSALAGAVFIVLSIACANVANLFLARGSARAGEIAIRYSLGATRRQIMMQLFTEGALYVAAGGLLGFVLAALTLPFFGSFIRQSFAFVTPMTIDGRMLALSFAFVVVAAVLTSLAPALALSRPDLSIELKRAGRAGALGAGGKLRAILITIEVAATVAVVVVTGLTLRTQDAHVRAPMGFAVNDRYLVSVNGTSFDKYGGDGQKQLLRLEAFQRALASIPGMVDVASTMAVPNWNTPDTSVAIAGRHYAPGSEPEVQFSVISPAFFAVMETPILLGRTFSDRDRIGMPPVAIVNASFAQTYFGGSDKALGRQILFGFTTGGQSQVPRTIVGISGNIRASVQRDIEPMAYMPAYQMPSVVGAVYFVAHARVAPSVIASQVRTAVAGVDPQLPVPWVRSLAQMIEQNIQAARIADLMLAILAGIALLLALGGVVAVIAYGVARRSHEIGIRLALGASAGSVIRLMMRSTLVPIAAGVALGIPLASLGARALDGVLIERAILAPYEEIMLVAFVVFVIAVAVYVPARRAARVDPLVALRYE